MTQTTLQVPTPLGPGEAAEAEITQASKTTWDTMEYMIAAAIKDGFHPPTEPDCSCPNIQPGEMQTLTSSKYALLNAQLEAWQSYAEGVMLWLDGILLQCDNEIDDLTVLLKRRLRQEKGPDGKKISEVVLTEMVKSNPRYREVKKSHQMMKQKRGMVESVYKRCGRQIRILSRSVEILKIEAGGGGTGGPRRDW